MRTLEDGGIPFGSSGYLLHAARYLKS